MERVARDGSLTEEPARQHRADPEEEPRRNRPRGESSPRLWNTTNLGFARLEAEALLLLLSERGVLASAGAACASGSLDPSPVLLAMGVDPEVAHGSVRFSLSRETDDAACARAAAIVIAAVDRLRSSTRNALGS